MSSNNEFSSAEPDLIYVVVWDNKHRIYVREGQAANWYSKKISEGFEAKLFSYSKLERLG